MKTPLLILFLIPLQLMSQSNITYYSEGIKYISCSIHFQSNGVSKPTDIDTLVFKDIPKLKDYRILMNELTPHSSQISIYKDTVLTQVFDLPFHKWFNATAALVVDIDKNNYPDIKLTYLDYDSLIGQRKIHKVYLFNLGDKFKLIRFFDFETETERDINKDGKLEILSCDKIQLNGKYYWVYNVFYFQEGELKNVSASFGYPLWFKERFSRWKKYEPAAISKTEIQTGYRELPNEYSSQ